MDAYVGSTSAAATLDRPIVYMEIGKLGSMEFQLKLVMLQY